MAAPIQHDKAAVDQQGQNDSDAAQGDGGEQWSPGNRWIGPGQQQQKHQAGGPSQGRDQAKATASSGCERRRGIEGHGVGTIGAAGGQISPR